MGKLDDDFIENHPELPTKEAVATRNICMNMKKNKLKRMGGGGGAVYGLGFIGALIYFLQSATSLGAGIIGILKAIVWPAFVVYKLLGFLRL